jgi:NTP pyrophosphatase (non-canonical NTP hydrolase)
LLRWRTPSLTDWCNMDYASFQADHAVWLFHEFPHQHPRFPACGMVEEAGELMHAILKSSQEIVWGKERRYSGEDWRAKLIDCIGDCAIYACSLCNTLQWSFDELMAAPALHSSGGSMELCAELVRLATDIVDEPLDRLSTQRYLQCLHAIAARCGINMGCAVEQTWQKVKSRCKGAAGASEIVTLCGSTRFRDAFLQEEMRLVMEGCIVFTVCRFSHAELYTPDETTKRAFDAAHMKKIELSHRAHILNVGGYIGESTARELAYAKKLCKRITYLEKPA